jgi:hypothetical protein
LTVTTAKTATVARQVLPDLLESPVRKACPALPGLSERRDLLVSPGYPVFPGSTVMTVKTATGDPPDLPGRLGSLERKACPECPEHPALPVCLARPVLSVQPDLLVSPDLLVLPDLTAVMETMAYSAPPDQWGLLVPLACPEFLACLARRVSPARLVQ